VTAKRLARVKDIIGNRQPDLTVFMDNVHKPHNVAAVVRTCDAVGVPNVHGAWLSEELRQSATAAMGSQRWVSVKMHDQSAAGIQSLKAEGMQVLAAHLDETAVDFRQIDYTKPTCIVMGQEKHGLQRELLPLVDQTIIVPMVGMVESLNVSVATALILYEAQRQRTEANLYPREVDWESPPVQQQIFEWMQPKMAQICQEKKIPYPPLDNDGDILNPSEWFAQYR
jgi:tRNA (guanosine-2'-O-)-methyltransferase